MNLPIVVFENSDVGVYSSAKQAALHLELADVKAELYDAYDIDGFLLDIHIKSIEPERKFLRVRWKTRRETVVIQDHYPKINSSQEIRARLIRYLLAMKHPPNDIENLSLIELAHIVSTYMPWKVTF